MMLRVSTFAMNERMLNASMKTQAKMAEMQLQEASNLISTDYSGISASARSLINMEVSLQRSKTFESSAKEANFRTETMHSQVGIMADVLTKFRTQVVAMRSTDRTEITSQTLIDAAKANLTQMANLLNSTYAGRYLFGGSVTTSPPVKLDAAYMATDPFAGPTTGYYLGDDMESQVQISTDHTVQYGVRANEQAFEKAMRAIKMMADATGNLEDADLDAAYALATEALNEVTVIQSRLGVTSGVLKGGVESQAEYQYYVEMNITNVKSVDIAKVAIQLSTYETQLNASYAALAKIQSVSLMDYLR
jgi:flagellar hook-associated protein 3 FlgL